MKFMYGIAAALSLLLASCTHTPPKGTVAMKVSDNVAHVAMKGVAQGEPVSLQTEVCQPRIGGAADTGASGSTTCRSKEVAQGFVSRVINNEYVEVEFPADVVVAEGQVVSVIR